MRMTNFEKWKAEEKEKITIHTFFDSFEGCYCCPVQEADIECDDDCFKAFEKWANSEVKTP